MNQGTKRIWTGALSALMAVWVVACADDAGSPLGLSVGPSFDFHGGEPAVPFSRPVPFPATLDNRTCLVGIFGGPQNLPLVHWWNVRVGGGAPQPVTLRIDAFSVNVLDRGPLHTKLRDLAGNPIDSLDLAFTGGSNTGDLVRTLAPGIYWLSLEIPAGPQPSPYMPGRHYTLGGSLGAWLGWAGPLHYNEPGGNFWSVNANAGEQVQVVLSVDDENIGNTPHQATSIDYEVRTANNTPGPVPPTTAAISVGQPLTISFTSVAGGAYLVRLSANGHFRKVKTSGTDHGFYGVRCPPPPPPPPTRVEIDIKPGSFPSSINLGKQGLVPVAVLTRTLDQATPQFPAFDATSLDPNLLRIMDVADHVPGIYPAGAIPVRGAVEDVDGDGDLDLVLHFDTQDLDDEGFQGGRFDPNTTAARLYGPVPNAPPGVRIIGDGDVNIVGK